jgi:hypothetical protein
MLERALQMLKVLKRWLPERDVVVVGDGNYAAIDFGSWVKRVKVC